MTDLPPQANQSQNPVLHQQRNSNLELLRIIAMVAIIAHHYVVNSGLTSPGGPIDSNLSNWRSLFLLLFGAWGKTGINCFVLITGYFMCTKEITLKKFVKLLAEIYFYKIIIFTILAFAGYQELCLKSFIKLLLPFSSINADFVGCFLIFYLFIPFLNKLIQTLSEKQHFSLIILLLVTYVLVASLAIPVTFNYVTWFSILFIVASYVRLHSNKLFENSKIWGWITVISLLFAIASIIICTIVPTMLGIKPHSFFFVSDSNKILAFIVGFSMFMFFKNVNIAQSKLINKIASTVFGILLIHANSDAMRKWLWQDCINCTGHYWSNYMPLYAFVCVIGIFIICSSIDIIRITFIEKPFLSFWEKKIDIKAQQLLNNIYNHLHWVMN